MKLRYFVLNDQQEAQTASLMHTALNDTMQYLIKQFEHFLAHDELGT